MQINQPCWTSQLSHTYMLARELPPRTPLRFSPEHQSFFSFNYLLDQKRSLTLQQTLWSSIWDLDFINNRNTRLPSWSSTDILLSQKINTLSSLQLGIYNLFNQRREMTFGYPEPQRRAALALEMTF
jgi:outer membrane receptor for ferrienterochelin and colicin